MAGDISYIRTSEGWLYLTIILDLYSHRVIGWAIGKQMKQDLAIWIWQWQWQWHCDNHPKGAFTISIVGRNIVPTSTRSTCPSMA